MWCKLALAATATALAPTATSRRRFVAGAAGAVVAAPLAGANAADVNKLNRKLDKLGLPPVDKLPDGFSPVLSSVNQEQSLFVQFVRPNDWLVVQPSVNTNGEDGTVSAGNYGKGDSSSLFVSGLKPGNRRPARISLAPGRLFLVAR